GRASRLWASLERALDSPRPVELALDAGGAYEFLRDAAPLLAQAGFGVLLPSWWRSTPARLGLRLKTTANGKAQVAATPGSLGLEPSRDGLPVVGVEAHGWIGELLRGEASRRLEPMSTPGTFEGSLRPYQERGLAWLAFLGSLGLGACLADDMGLGKTVQLL